nr:MAG TPA: minor capsid protein [Caudoviricetes sp.]
MLTPDCLKNVADDAINIYSKLEDSIIKDVVRRLKNTDFEMTESARFQIRIAQESGLLYDDIIEKAAKYSGVSEKIVKKTFENSAIEALKYDDKIYKKQGLNPIPIKQQTTMLNLLKNTLNKTNGSLYNLTLTTANTSQEKFIEVCNDAYMQISSGAFDYNTAIRKAIKQFGDGVQVEYDSGYRLNIKSAVKRAVMTGVNQTCLKMQELRAEEMRL